ncbi:vacuolar-sorting protein SNF8 [Aureococcus anophagefferens]|uniref:Vacuolar-sorting protein SNF8 n=1 Tax=Aureococcus anophagefferens TaxID=44056 RepID=A0ABR1GDW3_AURAN
MHRRRGVGVKAVKKKAQEKESYASKAAEMEATEAAHVGAFLATFRRSLEAFAAKHKRGIREDPVFRRQFTAMCYETGAPARAYYFPSVWLDARQKLAAG